MPLLLNKNLRITVLTIFIGVILSTTTGFSQNAYDTPTLNRAILKHFPGQELSDLQTQDPTKFNQIKYYFTNSFTVKRNDCDNCVVDYDEFFNYDLFNIVDVESTRKESANHTFLFKDGKYEITLYSYTAVVAAMNGLLPSEVLKLKVNRPFPEWIDTGNAQTDYANYKISVERWIRDFPDEYRVLTSTGNVLKVPVDEFLSFPANKKNAVLTNATGYIIID